MEFGEIIDGDSVVVGNALCLIIFACAPEKFIRSV